MKFELFLSKFGFGSGLLIIKINRSIANIPSNNIIFFKGVVTIVPYDQKVPTIVD